MRDKGAHFRRTDLQVHTPRDNQWKGFRPTEDADRVAYAEAFVAACREKGLGAVAITDHHDFTFFPFIKDAANSETDGDGQALSADERLVVFPGLELTLGVPCQALLIFDAELPLDRLPDVLAALSIEPVDSAEASLPSVIRADHLSDLGGVHEVLDLRDGLRGRYVLLPNVTDGGLGTLMRSGMQAKYREMPCVGGYLDGTVEKKVGKGNENIFAGLDKSRGHKPLALFQTSDARSEDFGKLGDPATWVKWSEPTAEAFRQACLAKESRISHTEPGLPTVRLTRLSVSNSKFMGPIELYLNPQYNAIIGGRGTGKSSILGYLRWALCDVSSRADDDEMSEIALREMRLIAATLGAFEATVDVHLSLNGIPHVVRRSAPSGEVTLKIGDSEFRPAETSEIRRLLPIQAYSQKQLSTVAVRVDELTRFVTTPIRRVLQDLDARSRDVDGRIREAYTSLQRFRRLDESISAITLELKSLGDQTQSLRSGLSGVSDADRAILDNKSAVDRGATVLESWREDTAATSEALAELIEDVETSQGGLEPSTGVWSELAVDAEAVRAAVDLSYSALVTDLRAALLNFDATLASTDHAETVERVTGQLSEFAVRYEDVKHRSTAHAEKLAELADLERQQEALGRKVRKEIADRDALGSPADTMAERRGELSTLMDERSESIDAECARLSELSDGMIRATLRRGQGLEAVRNSLRGFVAGSGVRNAKIDSLFDQLAGDDDPVASWNEVLSELEPLASESGEREFRTEDAPNAARLGLTSAELNKIARKATPDSWLNLALTPVEDHPVFEYRTREDDYIAFADASAGQQATALMAVLLAQHGPPLVIDQPEDDLDSQVVQDVVSRLWTAKAKRQIIFASHNANLVVNGDADLVVCCDYRVAGDQSGGKIKLEGAIDQSAVRSEITAVMEGGEKAFRLRKAKYGF